MLTQNRPQFIFVQCIKERLNKKTTTTTKQQTNKKQTNKQTNK
jgi:hypothetical protein